MDRQRIAHRRIARRGNCAPKELRGARLQRRVGDASAEQAVGEERDLHAELARRHDDQHRRRRQREVGLVAAALQPRAPHRRRAAARKKVGEVSREILLEEVLREAREQRHEVAERLPRPRRRHHRRVVAREDRAQRVRLHERRRAEVEARQPVGEPLGHRLGAPVGAAADLHARRRGHAVAQRRRLLVVLALHRRVERRLEEVEVGRLLVAHGNRARRAHAVVARGR